jgi:hypothetical protein
MLEMVKARKEEERYDLFSGFLDAAQDEPGSEAALSDDELIGWHPPSGSLGIPGQVSPFLLGNMFIFLFAGHEVGSLPSSSNAVPIQFSTDYSAYTMLLICLVGSISRRTRVSIPTHKRGYVQLERNACGFSESQFVLRADVSVGL